MILFDITTGQAFPSSDKPRSATLTERNAYLRWLAETRGVCIDGCELTDSGAWRGEGDERECVLEMPGYGVQPHVTCEILDDAGEVVSRMVLPDTGKGKLPMTAKQVQQWSGLKPVKVKAKAARKPVERAQPKAAVPDVAAEIASPAPVPAAQPVQSAPHVDSDLVVRVAALEAALARVGVAVMLSVPIAANDDAPAAPAAKRTASHERAIRLAWAARADARRQREGMAAFRIMLDAEEAGTRELREQLAAANARAADFERIAIAETARADEAEAQAANARRAATAYKREGDQLERTLWSERQRADGAARRAERMVRAAGDYRKQARRAKEDRLAAQAEARAAMKRLEAMRDRVIPARPAAPAPAPSNPAMAHALAAALN